MLDLLCQKSYIMTVISFVLVYGLHLRFRDGMWLVMHLISLTKLLWGWHWVPQKTFKLRNAGHDLTNFLHTVGDARRRMWLKSHMVLLFRSHCCCYQLFVDICDIFIDIIWASRIPAQPISVTSQWARWCLKSPASRLFTQPFDYGEIKENIKGPCRWPLCEEYPGDRLIPRKRVQ